MKNNELETPGGPDMAEMAFRQEDSDNEMLHRLQILFKCSDLSLPSEGQLNTKIEVSRLLDDGSELKIDCTEVLEGVASPNWQKPVTVDYCVQINDIYIARLVQE